MITTLHPKFVTDSAGCQIAVILPIEEYNGIFEDLDYMAVIAKRANEPTTPHAQVVKKLNC